RMRQHSRVDTVRLKSGSDHTARDEPVGERRGAYQSTQVTTTSVDRRGNPGQLPRREKLADQTRFMHQKRIVDVVHGVHELQIRSTRQGCAELLQERIEIRRSGQQVQIALADVAVGASVKTSPAAVREVVDPG